MRIFPYDTTVMIFIQMAVQHSKVANGRKILAGRELR